MDPLCKFAYVWGIIATITDMSYTAFVVPLSLAFNESLGIDVYSILDILGSAIYVLDWCFNFHIGFMVRWDQESVTITDGREVARFYMKKGTFWIDCLAIIPIFVQIVLIGIGAQNTYAVKIFMLMKLLRLLRVGHLISVRRC